MKTAAFCLFLSLCGPAFAMESPSFPFMDFQYMGVNAVRERAVQPLPRAAGVPQQDRLDKIHLNMDAGKGHMLVGWAENEGQYREAVSFWKAVLDASGIELGSTSFKDNVTRLPYRTPDGSVIRAFWASPRQFKPKDEASLRENRDMVLAELAKTNAVVASFVADLPAMLPTYRVYYLTRPEERPERETRLRILKPREDIDFDIVEKADIRPVQRVGARELVYIGPELGAVSLLGTTREALERKLAERAEYLAGKGKVMIGTAIHPVDSGEFRFVGNLYFYQ